MAYFTIWTLDGKTAVSSAVKLDVAKRKAYELKADTGQDYNIVRVEDVYSTVGKQPKRVAMHHGFPLQRGDVVSLLNGVPLTFAYLADCGRIATQELGENPRLYRVADLRNVSLQVQ